MYKGIVYLYRGQRSKDEIQVVLNKAEGYLKKFESSLSAQCYLGIGQIYSLVLNNFDAFVIQHLLKG